MGLVGGKFDRIKKSEKQMSLESSCSHNPKWVHFNFKFCKLSPPVKVKTGNLDSSARVLWDKGSNRVLIRHSFAKRHKLRAHKVDFKISVVGSVEKYEK